MKFETDFSDIDEQKPLFDKSPLLPKGKYLFQIEGCIDKTTAKGDPMGVVKLRCQDEGYGDVVIWDNIVIPKPNSPSRGIGGRTKHFLHCIGEPYKDNPLQGDTENWGWKKVYANVDIRKYKGEDQNEVKGYVLDESLIEDNNAEPDPCPF